MGIRDNFFDLGGHSLLGVKLISRLREEYQIDLPVRCLFDSPTIAALATRIETELKCWRAADREQSNGWSYLTRLQPGSSGKPVFLFPGGSGGDNELLVDSRLARAVGADYAFYGLRARSAEGKKPAHSSVEEMAADYLKEIRSFLPEGPYLIVGECIGGIVAYEASCQLYAQGHQVALTLMDTYRPTPDKYFLYRVQRFIAPVLSVRLDYYANRVLYHRQQARQLDWRNKITYFLAKTGSLLVDVFHVVAAADRRTRQIQESYMQVLRCYKPRPYPGRMSILTHAGLYRRDPTIGWGDLVSGVIDVYEAPGEHLSYIRDHFQATAKKLRECLEKAEKEL